MSEAVRSQTSNLSGAQDTQPTELPQPGLFVVFRVRFDINPRPNGCTKGLKSNVCVTLIQ